MITLGSVCSQRQFSLSLMSVLRARHEISIEEFPYGQYTVESLSFDLRVQFLCETLCWVYSISSQPRLVGERMGPPCALEVELVS